MSAPKGTELSIKAVFDRVFLVRLSLEITAASDTYTPVYQTMGKDKKINDNHKYHKYFELNFIFNSLVNLGLSSLGQSQG